MREKIGVERLDALQEVQRDIETDIIVTAKLLVMDHKHGTEQDEYWMRRLSALVAMLDSNSDARMEVCKTILGGR